VYKGYPVQYDSLYWGAVFPLAMYALCTYSLARAMHLEFLRVIPEVFVFVALGAWLVTFVGMMRRVGSRLTGVLKK
jgi:tellurite resistance protein TehA-like permease